MSTPQLLLTTMFMLGATGLAVQRTHLMSALLCIEAMMLTLFIMLTLYSNEAQSMVNTPAPILLLTMSACGAATGLSLLITTMRAHGDDQLKNLSLL